MERKGDEYEASNKEIYEGQNNFLRREEAVLQIVTLSELSFKLVWDRVLKKLYSECEGEIIFKNVH